MKRNLSLKLAYNKEENSFSPMFPKRGGLSPMTSLSSIMGELNCVGDTPKRRLSMTGTGDTPVSSRGPSRISGFSLECPSPTMDDSTFLDDEACTAFRRSYSNPEMRRPSSPPVFSLKQEISDSQVEATDISCQPMEVDLKEGDPKVGDPKGGHPKGGDLKGGDPKGGDLKEAVRTRAETIKWEVSVDKENINIQLEPAVRPQTMVVNSPVKLQYCRLTSSNDDSDCGDGYTEIFSPDTNSTSDVSKGLGDLINAPLIINSPPTPKSSLYQSGALLPLDANALVPKVCRGIFKVPSQPINKKPATFLKRPERPRDSPSPVQNKRYRSASVTNPPTNTEKETCSNTSQSRSPRPRPLGRSHSMDEGREYHAAVDSALMHNVDYTKLAGDRKKQLLLPVCDGKHQDLQSITPETLCRVLRSEFKEVSDCHILDCRYPFEYDGGHIKGAKNVYTKELITEHFLEDPMEPLDGRIIIFHCEFSSKRGPEMLRFLRNQDRDANVYRYPALYYPEMYILLGGYKAFFEYGKTWCEPPRYLPMDSEKHKKDCSYFKAKSKSWEGERSRLPHRKTSACL